MRSTFLTKNKSKPRLSIIISRIIRVSACKKTHNQLSINNDVILKPVFGGAPKVIAHLYGEQGTKSMPSWSPDSKHIAFVSNSGI